MFRNRERSASRRVPVEGVAYVAAMADGTPSAAATGRSGMLRRLGTMLLVAVLVGAIFVRRDTITAALGEIGSMSVAAIGVLVALATYERWSRADIVARLLSPLSTRDGFVVHDVGNAVSKGVPMGGALGTALRWSIVNERKVGAARFTTMLIAYGVATTFVTWLLPAAFLSIDIVGRPITATDGVLLLVLTGGMIAQIGFWYVVLGSDRIERWSCRFAGSACNRVAKRLPSLGEADADEVIGDVRVQLRSEARRGLPLLLRTALAQACGAVILLVALRALGVGAELGVTEFFRVFFITHLLGTFAPTPGGVGVVEAGMSGALVAAGVDPSQAFAGVLVYRFLTYIVPIVTGTALYLSWRRAARVDRAGLDGPAEADVAAEVDDVTDPGVMGPADPTARPTRFAA